MKLKKISEEHYIIIDDANEVMYTIPLSEVKELIGEVNKVEELSLKMGLELYVGGNYDFENGVRKGYNQALEDNKEKKYTEEDMVKAIRMARKGYDEFGESGFIRHGFDYSEKDVIQSLQPKTEWEVEFVDGKLQLVKE